MSEPIGFNASDDVVALLGRFDLAQMEEVENPFEEHSNEPPALCFATAASLQKATVNTIEAELRKRCVACHGTTIEVDSRNTYWFFIDEPGAVYAPNDAYWTEEHDDRLPPNASYPFSAFRIKFKQLPAKLRDSGPIDYTMYWNTKSGLQLYVFVIHKPYINENPKKTRCVSPKPSKNDSKEETSVDLSHNQQREIVAPSVNYTNMNYSNNNNSNNNNSMTKKITKFKKIVRALNGDKENVELLAADIRKLVNHMLTQIGKFDQMRQKPFKHLSSILTDLETAIEYPEDFESLHCVQTFGMQTIQRIFDKIQIISIEKFIKSLNKLKESVNSNNIESLTASNTNAPGPTYREEESKKRKRSDGSAVVTVSNDIGEFLAEIDVLKQMGPRVFVDLDKLKQRTSSSLYWQNICELLHQRQSSDHEVPLETVTKLITKLGGTRRVMHVVKELFHPSVCIFYHGSISSDKAEEILLSNPIGSFLLRDPSKDDYFLAISYMTKEGPKHAQIILTETGFNAQRLDQSFKNFDRLETLLQDIDRDLISQGILSPLRWNHIQADTPVEMLSPDKYKGVNFIANRMNGLNVK